MQHPEYLWLAPLGIAVGAFGTLIGAGGGFILAPILLMLYPAASPETITSISLATVLANASSGSVAYARMKRIDYRSGLVFALAALPGTIVGAVSTSYVPRRAFDAVFGLVFIVLSMLLMARPTSRTAEDSPQDAEPAVFPSHRPDRRRVFLLGGALSTVIGYVSSFLGIGGGIVHVPILSRVLRFPVHTATATSHFVLALMALSGTITHIATGSFAHGVHRALILCAGVVVGAQAGALASTKISGAWILRALAVALALVGARVLWMARSG